MLKQKLLSIFEALLYIMLAFWLAENFFAFNKYDWMIETGENICSIPSLPEEERILQAVIAAFFLLTPLIIIILRKLCVREIFEFWLYVFSLVICLVFGWWLFWGRLIFCYP